MLFSTPIFLFAFLPLVWIINRLLKTGLSNVFLCVASLFFYAWGEPVYVLLMVASSGLNWLFARGMPASKHKKTRLILALVCNLAILAVFKYAGFAAQTLNALMGLRLPDPGIALPIGISFFTFQAMSYVVDAYKEKTAPQRSFLKVLLYISFFPQMVAGPIVKYHEISEQIEHRTVTAEQTARGIRRFCIGLAKKVLIANTLSVTVDAIHALPASQLSLPLAWIAALAYILQLYHDFSGYSDMAIGLGVMFGFRFPENFNYPLVSRSVREFWTRWHISLSSWFRDYLYIPLGGNRKGQLRTGVNKVIVFFLTGLWHGAQWTFVVWGLIHGFFMLVEQYLFPRGMGKRLRFLPWLYTSLVVVLSFVLFRAESFSQALALWGNMFAGGLRLGMQSKLLTPLLYAAGLAGCIGCLPLVPALQKKLHGKLATAASAASYAAAFGLLVLCVLALASGTHNPFIYLRF